MHWKDGPVEGFDAQFMPMLELSDDHHGGLFQDVINNLGYTPSVLLGQNEIDVDGTFADARTAYVLICPGEVPLLKAILAPSTIANT